AGRHVGSGGGGGMGRGPRPGLGRKPGQGWKQGQKPGPGRKQGQKPGQGRKQGQKPGPGQKPGQGPRPGAAALPRSRAGLTPRSFCPRKEKLNNLKPKQPDEQEIPFRLRELMRSREAMKRPDPRKRQAAEKKQQPKPKVPKPPRDNPVTKFRRGKGESERSFVCRMEQEVQRVMFLTENQVQQEPEKEGMAPEKSKRKKEYQNKKLEKARKKKEEKKEAMLEKKLFQGGVAFGEVVTQPPTITSRPRGRGSAEQAGRKKLLLTSRLGQSLVSPASPAVPMSMARQRIVEEERARVIQAYRDIQRRKQQQREAARGSTQAGRRVPR
ncbi:CC137 protein, partial [Centropus unirufus]|nr:CC137 protein [Centropus unirufus]